MRKYGLTLDRIAQSLRRQSIETPSGQMRTDGQEILLRGKNKRESKEEIESLPVVTQPNGAVLTVGDIAKVVDDFDDVVAINEVNGKPALVIEVARTADEDLLAIAGRRPKIRKESKIESGYRLMTWGDESVDVRDRMQMLIENGCQGAIIVFLILALFLDKKLAFWVAMGIPVSVFGAGIVLIATGRR